MRAGGPSRRFEVRSGKGRAGGLTSKESVYPCVGLPGGAVAAPLPSHLPWPVGWYHETWGMVVGAELPSSSSFQSAIPVVRSVRQGGGGELGGGGLGGGGGGGGGLGGGGGSGWQSS